MNENVPLKLISIVGFLVFAAISCWATAESLHLLLPSCPLVASWAVSVGFFFIASWGTKMVTDSLNQNVYVERRSAMLFGGVLIVLLFWLACSMPTNTHTFFYRHLINGRVSNDIAITQGYLTQIKDGTTTEANMAARIMDFKNKVEVKMGELEAEICNEANPGFGPKSKQILSEFATMLDVVKIEPLSYGSTSVQARRRLCNAYRQKIFILRDAKVRNIRIEMTPSTSDYRKVAERDWRNLNIVKNAIGNKLDLNDANDTKMICDKLNDGYADIKMYSQFVNFKSEMDRQSYTADKPQTKVTRLLSVYDVWRDFIGGREGGLVFTFWIIISILVDMAAFVFFNIAFRRKE